MKSLLLFVYAILGGLGLTLIKKSLNTAGFSLSSIKSPGLLTGFGLYALSFILWIIILKENDLSYAFPVASGALFISISIFSIYLLGEELSLLRLLGMGFIFVGIVLGSRG